MPGKRKLDSRIPVTILTGFLGSGKTTLVNHILHSPDHGMKFAVIENEFGDVGVDDGVIKKESEEQIIEMMNGCICCTVRSDLIVVLKKLLERRPGQKGGALPFDAVLIETTGLADPAPVAQTFFADPVMQQNYRLDAIVTVVDAKHVMQHLDEVKPEGVENETVEQIAFADRILLNKTDLVPDEEELTKVEKAIKGINSAADIIRTTYGVVHPQKLINVSSFSLERIVEMDPKFLEPDGEHQHDRSVSSLSFKFEGEVNISKLDAWIGEVLKAFGNDLFRYKGILAVKGMAKKYVFQGVHMLFNGSFVEATWKPGEKRECRFVFIGRKMQENEQALTEGFELCKVTGPLRFKVGDAVFANCSQWEPGWIVQLWDEGNPYKIQLMDGTMVWGPQDTDTFVRSRPGAVPYR